MTEMLKDFWSVIAGGVALVVWLVRLEGKGIANASDIKLMKEQRREDLERQRSDQDKTEELLREIRQDIKTLMVTK
jgi:hypothetical protein